MFLEAFFEGLSFFAMLICVPVLLWVCCRMTAWMCLQQRDDVGIDPYGCGAKGCRGRHPRGAVSAAASNRTTVGRCRPAGDRLPRTQASSQ